MSFPANGSRLFFLHIPKTAGMALVAALASKFPENQVLVPPNHSANGITTEDLRSARFIALHAYAGFIDKFIQRPVVLTVLRHPIDRAFSQYHYGKATPVEHFPDDQKRAVQKIQETETLLHFIEDSPEEALDQLGNLQVKYLSRKDRNWLLPERGEDALQIAKQSLREFEFVGILERLRDFLTLLAFRMRWPPLEVPRVNVNLTRPSLAAIDDRTLQRLKELNNLDIELYQFGCELFEQRWSEMLDELLNSRAKTGRRILDRPRLPSGAGKARGKPGELMAPLPASDCRITVVSDVPKTLKKDVAITVPVILTNLGAAALSSDAPYPVRLSYRWISQNSKTVQEGPRTQLAGPLRSGKKSRIKIALKTPTTPGAYQLRITLVQEGIRWFDAMRTENSWVSDIMVK